MAEAKQWVEKAEQELTALAKQRTQVTKDKGLVARKLTAEETGAEQLRAKRHQLIVKARVEQVLLPIVGGGTTADVDPQAFSQAAGASQGFSQSGDVSATAATSGFSQSASRAVQADQELTANIDFSELPDKYTSIDDRDEYSRVEADFMEKLRGLAAEIERMQPNMKATEQFKDIETRLQDTVENLETARQEVHIACSLCVCTTATFCVSLCSVCVEVGLTCTPHLMWCRARMRWRRMRK